MFFRMMTPCGLFTRVLCKFKTNLVLQWCFDALDFHVANAILADTVAQSAELFLCHGWSACFFDMLVGGLLPSGEFCLLSAYFVVSCPPYRIEAFRKSFEGFDGSSVSGLKSNPNLQIKSTEMPDE